MVRKIVQVKGIVQGVGFRPFVYKKALQYSLKGRVMNTGSGVIIDIEGSKPHLETFLRDLFDNPPALAEISDFKVEEKEAVGYQDFEIVFSQASESKEALVPPDIALCPDCKRDIFDSRDRHFLYPFTNCTNCGPRFTIVKDIPYDRGQTTMKEFIMCPDCRQEYENPLDRRFHAQPGACPKCGPQVRLVDQEGSRVELDQDDPYLTFRRFIKEGKVVALKGLGGFHLACNANDYKAIAKLRERKNRPAKPFAVMARDVAAIKRYCRLNELEERVLTGPIAPIVILERFNNLPENLAPSTSTLGVMVPYTPLHFLLFDEEIDFLVMTSGNLSNLPLVRDNEEALRELGEIADYFLLHDREIHNRCDDSLVKVTGKEMVYWRRSRGAVPQAIKIPVDIGSFTDELKDQVAILGTGSEMKNTFCLLKGSSAFMSQHIGELDSLEAIINYRESLENFSKLIDVQPRVLGYDLHPGYQVTKLARELPLAEKIPVQHHHAHMASCMAENDLDEDVIGVILDGTGYGLDGNFWGFELFTGNFEYFKRQGHLTYVPLPGGERAIRNPWLTAVAYLIANFPNGQDMAKNLFPQKKGEIELAAKLIAGNINSPLSSGCGRLFDAVSALLGICTSSSYEGQAAIELGALLKEGLIENYPFEIKDNKGDACFEISPKKILAGILEDIELGLAKEDIATKFHNTVVEVVIAGTVKIRRETGLRTVVISGGTWHNEYLLLRTKRLLQDQGFTVYSHSKVPTNDGGLALGQAMVAYRRWQKKCV